MSALGQKATLQGDRHMSTLPSEADIVCEFDLGRDGPIADYERSPRGQSAKKKAPAKFAGAKEQ